MALKAKGNEFSKSLQDDIRALSACIGGDSADKVAVMSAIGSNLNGEYELPPDRVRSLIRQFIPSYSIARQDRPLFDRLIASIVPALSSHSQEMGRASKDHVAVVDLVHLAHHVMQLDKQLKQRLEYVRLRADRVAEMLKLEFM
eukprot:CAMPEP_0113938084 /NCGR_PEP_ID=MMETSP1339-20121228/4499_1 /TAXON_ID=94617 /ORGANISM="Fibrocapsa japonica" /LENGTH=143 /DNA_ID=CAMNT_0000941021 /DNA_START=86 /DNA_END=517 /DNA_ORIENTATION=+ /assembly_acc=CAM_ASM_000762